MKTPEGKKYRVYPYNADGKVNMTQFNQTVQAVEAMKQKHEPPSQFSLIEESNLYCSMLGFLCLIFQKIISHSAGANYD